MEKLYKNGHMKLEEIKRTSGYTIFKRLNEQNFPDKPFIVASLCKYSGDTVNWSSGEYNLGKCELKERFGIEYENIAS